MRQTTMDKELKRSRHANKSKKDGHAVKIFFIFIFCIVIICCYTGLFLLYGPYSGFRDWLITTAMTTMNHQYLATWFYDEETINDCLAKNSTEDTNEATDTDLINIVDHTENYTTYANEYERDVLERDPANNDYKIIEIEGKKYSGLLAVIYEPSRIKVACTSYLGSSGQYLTTLSKNYNSFVAINAGGFADEGGDGTGGTPDGNIISEGRTLWTGSYYAAGGMIGFNNDDKLVLGKYTATQAQTLGIRDAVTFGPFLIVNGESVAISGNGGAGTAPRTAIGQRQDGIVLFLVLDGDRTLGNGATYRDVQEIMENYGAYNAANLDGGTSTSMTVHSSLVNDPTTQSGTHRTRPIATAFYLEADESDDGDYSVVKNKVEY